MRYTIIYKDKTVFYSDWYNEDEYWNEDFHFMIINNISHQYTTNGKDWTDIEEDNL